MERRGLRVLVTGGTGFVGGALARRLQAEGARVTALGRDPAAGARLERDGIAFTPADLADAQAVARACQGQDCVFHAGALAAPWGRYADFYAANVTGTENVARGCRQHSVRRLVHVSTPSVYFAGQPRRNVSEADPLPDKYFSHYAHTKRLAERVITRAHAEGQPVISIRPRAIIGAGDTSLLPRLVRPLRTGLLPVIGDGQTLADLTCVENVVEALLLSAEAPDQFLGRTYNITNGQPVRLWDAVRQLCRLLGFPAPRWRLPLPAALALAGAVEAAFRLARPNREPPLTRFAVRGLALDATLDIGAAQRDLGYAPRVSVDEGLARFAAWWQAGRP